MLVIDGVPIRRRLGSAYARQRLAEALYEIARDGLATGLPGSDAATARSWLRDVLERPISRASDAALDRFCAEVELLIEEGPPCLRGSLGEEDRG